MTSLKRLTLWTLLAALVVAFLGNPAFGYVQGDMNDDQDVTLGDAILIMKFMSKMRLSKPLQKEVGVGSDPRIGLDDLVYVLQVISGLRSKNSSPKASFSTSVEVGEVPLLVEFDASGSSDSEGSIVGYLWNFGDGKSGSGASVSHSYRTPGTYPATLTVTDEGGARGVFTKWIAVKGRTEPPPDPATVAPLLDTTVPTNIKTATEFLYTGVNPIQEGVLPDKIDQKRAAVLRGKVTERDGEALPGVRVTVLDHPEFGQTLTREDGLFDLAVNGGWLFTVRYEKPGFLTAQRRLETPWNDILWLPDVAMVPVAVESAALNLSGTEPIQVVQGPEVVDERGTRRSTLLVAEGTGAQMVLPGGATQPFNTETLTVRATEYTVGDDGPPAMPDELPPGVGYTYCVELSVDEAAGAASVVFDRPLYHYVENFLDFPVGDTVPNYYYDREKARWVKDASGKVIKILDTAQGVAAIDLDGDDVAEDASALASLGFSDAELSRLAMLYSAGQTLWRVPLTHFSPIDYNWPIPEPPVRPETAVGEPQLPNPLQDPCSRSGSSLVECQNQVLGETIPIAGTPFSLNYRSDRLPGRLEAMGFEILVIPDPRPQYLIEVTVEVTIAGQRHTEKLAALTPGLFYRFEWDGKDAYGRRVEGQMPARMRVGYTYRLPYLCSNPILCAQSDFTYWAERSVLLGARDMRSLALGGWTLSPHHAYDSRGPRLYQGDGRTRSVRAEGVWHDRIVVAGSQTADSNALGDGGPAVEAYLYRPTDIAFSPDGGFYIADSEGLIRKVDLSGIITTVAGSFDIEKEPEDGGLATDGWLDFPMSVAAAADGSFFFPEFDDARVCKVGPDGIITTVAGTGGRCVQPGTGDGGPAFEAQLCDPVSLALGPDGTLYIGDFDNCAVRKVDPRGIITTAAGSTCGYSGDGGPANEARMRGPVDLALGPDGTLYIADTFNHRVRAVSPQGIITTVAGNGQRCYPNGLVGDGGPATSACVSFPNGLAVARDGSLFIACGSESLPDGRYGVIRRVSPQGVITTVPIKFAVGDSGWNNEYPRGLAVGPDGALYATLGGALTPERRFVYRIGPALPGHTWETALLASDEREEVYRFEGDRHTATLSARTGATIYKFDYDGRGLLSTVIDFSGNVTTVERDAAGRPTAIVAPGGGRTALTTSADGFLTSITDPAGNRWSFTYTADGLMTKTEDPNGHVSEYGYDGQGLLASTKDGAGGGWALAKEEIASGRKVTVRSAQGVQTEYATQWFSNYIYQANIGCCGTTWSDTRDTGVLTYGSGDGSSLSVVMEPDPRFGRQSPYVKTLRMQTPGGRSFAMSRSVEVGFDNPMDPFSVNQYEEWVHVGEGVSAVAYRKEYIPDLRQEMMTTPVGRTRTTTYDDAGRVVGRQRSGLAPTNLVYDAQGRIASVTQGEGAEQRIYGFGYNADGSLANITDPLGRDLVFSRDAAGRIMGMTLPGGHQVGFSLDAGGNLTGLTTPGGSTHSFAWSPVNRLISYSPPFGLPNVYAYDLDRRPIREIRPDGVTVDMTYDSGGRPASLSWPGGTQTYAFYPTNRNLQSITAADGGQVTFGFDGPLATFLEWAGTVSGRVDFDYNNRFQLTAVAVNGSAIPITRDRDGLVTGAGALTLTRDSSHGLVTGASLGGITEARGYNAFGEVAGYTVSHGVTALYQAALTRDLLGRIVRKAETVEGVTSTYDYIYDVAGRLVEVRLDGIVSESYVYDPNGNRVSATNSAGTGVSASYDAQDSLLFRGASSYAYTAAGELAGKTTGGQTTTYTYDVLGNLLEVYLPSGTRVSYVVDGLGRRIGKRVSGSLVKGLLYQDRLRPAAELDGEGNVVSRFVYASKRNVPDYMVREGVTYRIVSDHLGSVRLVVNAADGSVAQRMDYDAFGRVLLDTNPGFQPFGFAGGLYDPDTGLTRFGARDYDADAGRWTAKDPIGFRGGDTNLYAYVSNDPVNWKDPSGRVVPIVAAVIGLVASSDAAMAILVSPVVAADVIDFIVNAAASSGLAPSLDPGPGATTIGTGIGAAAGMIVGTAVRGFLDWVDEPSDYTVQAGEFADWAEAWNDDYERQIRELQQLLRPCP